MKNEILRQIDENIETKKLVREQCIDDLEAAITLLSAAFKNGNKALICGNGGSAADSQHIAAEFVSSYTANFMRPSIPAIALTLDTSMMTAYGNDFGFEGIFERQVEGLGKEGDVLIGLSTSGNSGNVVKAVGMARKKGIKTIAFLGRDGGKLKDIVDIAIVVPSQLTSRIQESHILLYHIMCDLVETELFGELKEAAKRPT